MAIAEDASTPAVASLTGAGAAVTASFTPPANSLLVALVAGGWSNNAALSAVVTDSVSGSWTAGPVANQVNTAGGLAAVFTRYLSTAPGSMTVTATYTNLQGGRLLAVRVLTGAASNQTGAGSNTKVASGSPAGTDGTLSITTTGTGSQVYGVSDDSGSNDTWTANAATSELSKFVDATDVVTMVAWKATNVTGVPGATTLGGTWGASDRHNEAVLEILPAPPVLPPQSLYVVTQALRSAYL